jgi:hypothetical protein
VSPLGLAAGADEHRDGHMPDDNGITDLHSLSDAVLCRLAGLTQEKLMLQ